MKDKELAQAVLRFAATADTLESAKSSFAQEWEVIKAALVERSEVDECEPAPHPKSVRFYAGSPDGYIAAVGITPSHSDPYIDPEELKARLPHKLWLAVTDPQPRAINYALLERMVEKSAAVKAAVKKSSTPGAVTIRREGPRELTKAEREANSRGELTVTRAADRERQAQEIR